MSNDKVKKNDGNDMGEMLASRIASCFVCPYHGKCNVEKKNNDDGDDGKAGGG